ncbi:MAG: DEAD/DEAH box helicase [Helicobacter sp.]|uniref:DEAD/DEAH box helicase n=1 Tax=Helicobacter sp. 10-6591 TaxID=2004998 RepID=UPI000DCC704E|nr:DEAD/DEAH box helicase [Helicobacter sp. 10-6591]MCI6216982.1 DEAD/DEAH box helicase [Helicobacter sp.]MCI7485805.1 DEAD/DEAH box helicase [Helicobacter sp.]MDD7567128.1 DEAD/DEAH box helicase [Helicobacter sp.]MDY5740470.1 DEAD/DEAH box helicase [Helicobacter sp.]RAX54143.1 DEAD/DEAH box helicase [Helicobacter sp. 10-6591]
MNTISVSKATDTNQDIQSQKDFSSFGLREYLLKGISELGFSTPSPIQEQSIPIVLSGGDLIAQAQTGTGKTAAFAIPILNKITRRNNIEALIITPTRELAMQINDEFLKLGRFARIKTICMYGGQSIKRQCDLLKNNPKIMIATPGRLLDHLMNGRLQDFTPRIVVLDESDEMLDMGFLDDIEQIFSYLPSSKQTLLFSATMPEAIQNLALKILHEPKFVKISPIDITNKDIEQKYYIINESEREEAIIRLLEIYAPTKSIIFTRTKREADMLAKRLFSMNFNAAALHGDMEQWDRKTVITNFRQSKIEILVATDVASRGLDISEVSHVFNYHIPINPESYVHRIGRTGRAGKKGIAITLATPLEFKEINKIKQTTKAQIELCEIESTEVLDKQQLLGRIASIEVSQNAEEMLEILKNEMDFRDLCLKLLSNYIATQCAKTIGLKKDEIAKLEAIEYANNITFKMNAKTAKARNSKKNTRQSVKSRYSSGSITDSIWG